MDLHLAPALVPATSLDGQSELIEQSESLSRVPLDQVDARECEEPMVKEMIVHIRSPLAKLTRVAAEIPPGLDEPLSSSPTVPQSKPDPRVEQVDEQIIQMGSIRLCGQLPRTLDLSKCRVSLALGESDSRQGHMRVDGAGLSPVNCLV